MLVGILASSPATTSAQTTNPIVVENGRQGSTGWRLSSPSDDLNKQIKGYPGRSSVNVGESISFHVSVNRPQTFAIDIYRLGYYGGSGGRLMTSSGTLNGVTQSFPPLEPASGFVEYNWPAAYTLAVPSDWVSGVYLAKLTNADGYDNWVPFAVRDDQQQADLLFQRPVLTDHAYNNFPNVNSGTPGFDADNPAHVGKGLYEHVSGGGTTVVGTTRAVKVSMNRPFSGHGAAGLFIWEFELLKWLEKEGYNVTYSTNIDTHADPSRLLDVKGFISPAHDEYWTSEMFSSAEQARDSGVNLAFFGANAVYHSVRLESSATGVANRTVVDYKNWNADPITDPTLKSVRFRDKGRPEQTLVGVQYVDYGERSAQSDYVPTNVNHWIYAGTGLTTADRITGIIGSEIDISDPNAPLPANTEYSLLSASPYTGTRGTNIAQTSIYEAPSGAWVFGAATLSWSWGLSRSGYVDSRLEQMTRNLLDVFVGSAGGGSGADGNSGGDSGSGNGNSGGDSGSGNSGACAGLSQEAEDGTIIGTDFVVGNDPGASEGKFVHVRDGSGNYWSGPDNSSRIDYCFTVDQAGVYQISGGVNTLTNYSDSFFVTVDGALANAYTWDTRNNQSYLTDYVNDRNGADPVQVSLSAGEHTVSLFRREDGTRLDTLSLELITPNDGGSDDGGSDGGGESEGGVTGGGESEGGGSGTTGGGCAGMFREAEDGTIVGNRFVIGNDPQAGNSRYVHVPDGSGNIWSGPDQSARIDYCFTVDQAGVYKIGASVNTLTNYSDSFYVRVDGVPANGYVWDTKIGPAYKNDFVNSRSGADPVLVQLDAGQHMVSIYGREDGTRLDSIHLELVSPTGGGGGSGEGATSCGPPSQEAEDGDIVGNRFIVGFDSEASGGQYVHTPDGSGNVWSGPDQANRIDYCFSLAAGGVYRISGGVHTLTNYSDSFFVTVDGTPASGYTWDVRLNQRYLADLVNNRGGDDPIEVALNAGDHIVSVYPREDGTRLDTINLELVGP